VYLVTCDDYPLTVRCCHCWISFPTPWNGRSGDSLLVGLTAVVCPLSASKRATRAFGGFLAGVGLIVVTGRSSTGFAPTRGGLRGSVATLVGELGRAAGGDLSSAFALSRRTSWVDRLRESLVGTLLYSFVFKDVPGSNRSTSSETEFRRDLNLS
jgi:hypothetical protein